MIVVKVHEGVIQEVTDIIILDVLENDADHAHILGDLVNTIKGTDVLDLFRGNVDADTLLGRNLDHFLSLSASR